MTTRLELIKKWIEYSPPEKKLMEQLEEFGWDYEGKPFEIRTTHFQSILERYLRDELNEDEVYQWANFIEMREDIDYDKFKDIIFFLATPEINGVLSRELAKKWILDLKN